MKKHTLFAASAAGVTLACAMPAAAQSIDYGALEELFSEPVTTSAELTRRVAGAGPNRRLEFEIVREGRPHNLAVRTGTRPPPRQLSAIF